MSLQWFNLQTPSCGCAWFLPSHRSVGAVQELSAPNPISGGSVSSVCSLEGAVPGSRADPAWGSACQGELLENENLREPQGRAAGENPKAQKSRRAIADPAQLPAPHELHSRQAGTCHWTSANGKSCGFQMNETRLMFIWKLRRKQHYLLHSLVYSMIVFAFSHVLMLVIFSCCRNWGKRLGRDNIGKKSISPSVGFFPTRHAEAEASFGYFDPERFRVLIQSYLCLWKKQQMLC